MSGIASNLTQSVHLCGIAIPSVQFQNKSKELLFSEAIFTRNQKDLEHAAFAAQSSLWENGQVLDYSFFGGTPNQHSKVEDTIQEWTWYANITFTRSTPNNRDATLRIAFDPTKGSWSYVGNAARDCDRSAPTMNLGWISDTDTLMRHERGVILHQFGHVLGLMHEHEHPMRSGIRRLREAEVLQYYKQTQGLDESTVRRQVLGVYSETSVSSHSQHDPTSIMTYFMPASMNEGGVDIPEVTELSMFDKAFAVVNYPRKRTHPCAHQWTPYFALAAAGASADAISVYLGEINISEKRKVFSREMVELRLHETKRFQLQDKRKVPYAQNIRLGVVEHAPRILTVEEKLQNTILSLLFNIAPKVLLSSDISSIGAQLDLDNLTLEHPIVQRGLSGFFTKLVSNMSVKKVLFGAANITAEVRETRIQKIQNGILSLLFDVAPKALLVPTLTTNISGTLQESLNPDNLTLDHPTVQRGLTDFFTKLASNTFVKKAIFGAVHVAPEIKLSEEVHKQTHIEKVQDGILSLLFDIAPKSLLVSTLTTNDISSSLDLNNLTLDHPTVQRGLVDFFSKLASHKFVKKAIFSAVNVTAEVKLSEDIQNLTYAEKIQNGVLSLLFNIAPKALLVPTVITTGLDLNHITLDHPVVQRGLVEFFSKLSSNTFVKKAILGAVNITTELKLSGNIENGIRYQTHSEKAQNAVLSLLFDIAPKNLLIPDLTTSSLDISSLTLDHPVVQRGLVDFFAKLTSNKFVKTAIYGAVNLTAEVKYSGGIENGVRNQAYTEKVQNAILSLLLDIAPKQLLAPNVTDVYGTLHGALDLNNITLDHPVVQRGLVDFFTKLSSNKLVKKAILDAVNVAPESKLPGNIRNQTHAEKVQNGILHLLFNIAPKSLLVPNATTNGVSSILHTALDLNSLTLDHPVVQRGLTDFFAKLASNQAVKKAIFGAVNITAELKVSGDIKHGIRDQTYAEKVQNGILSLLLGIAPKTLLAPNVASSGTLDFDNLTLDHPVVQRGLADFFMKLASNKFVRKAILGAVDITAGFKLSGNTEIGIQTQKYAEKVQDGIFSLLLNIAPKHLLTPDLTALGISGTLHAAIDLNHLSLENAIVQRGLLDFFIRLASNAFVRKAILSAVDATVEFKQPHIIENGSFGLDVDTISSYQLARLVSLILEDRSFKDGVTAMSLGKTQKAEEYTITVAKKGEYV